MELYKYRTLSDIERLFDILAKNRLYAATYEQFEDDQEGHYYSDNIPNEIVREMRNAKQQVRICSLCKSSLIQEMWDRYADNGKGLCMQVQANVKRKKWICCKTHYNSNLPFYGELQAPQHLDVMKNKLKNYEHEAEIRYIKSVKASSNNKIYLPIVIEKIYLGYKMPDEDKNMIRTLVKHLNSNITIEEIDINNIKPYKEL